MTEKKIEGAFTASVCHPEKNYSLGDSRKQADSVLH